MYCRTCGNEMPETADVCIKCGTLKGNGNKYCPNCGKETITDSNYCPSCGKELKSNNNFKQKSKLLAGLLGIFLGMFGVYNFYLGYTDKAIAQLLICLIGSFLFGLGPIAAGIWGIIEGIYILTGKIDKDAYGIPLTE